MKSILKFVALVIVGTFILSSCEKNPGEVGNASIIGSVWEKNYNLTFTELIGEYAAVEQDVYIVYGENVGFDDKTETDYLGNYRFNYLRPGHYTIFVYSEDSSMTTVNGEYAILKEIEITSSDEVLSVPQITIFN